jgi:CIC family chloride channel protein
MSRLRDGLSSLSAWLSTRSLRGRLPTRFDRENRRLVIQSALVGAAVWGPVFALKLAVPAVFGAVVAWLERVPIYWLVAPLLLGAAVVAWAVTRGRTATIAYYDQDGHLHELVDVEGDGLERAIALYYAAEPSFERALLGKEGVEVRWELPTFSLAGRKFIATLATLGSGGSGGLEGSVALIGEGIAAAMFKPRSLAISGAVRHWLRKPLAWWSTSDTDHLQAAQLSGVAAAIATLTGAPFMSAFFAAEVMYRRRPLVDKLLYSLISTLVAYFLSTVAHVGHRTLFAVETLYLPPDDWRYYGVVLIMSLVVALSSMAFVALRRMVESQFHQRLHSRWARHLTGALLTALVALVVVALTAGRGLASRGEALHLVLSTGGVTIDRALAGELTLTVALVALLGKMAATATTIGSGGSGGLLIPSLYLGAMVAAAFGAVVPFPAMTLIVPAMTVSLVSIANVPLAGHAAARGAVQRPLSATGAHGRHCRHAVDPGYTRLSAAARGV